MEVVVVVEVGGGSQSWGRWDSAACWPPTPIVITWLLPSAVYEGMCVCVCVCVCVCWTLKSIKDLTTSGEANGPYDS